MASTGTAARWILITCGLGVVLLLVAFVAWPRPPIDPSSKEGRSLAALRLRKQLDEAIRNAPRPAPPAPPVPDSELPLWGRKAPPPAKRDPKTPPLAFSAAPPSSDPGQDDRSPTLARVLEVVRPTPAQQTQIRVLWKQHEDGRRTILALPSPSYASTATLHRDELRSLDGAFEMGLVSQVLEPDQRQRLLDATH